MGQLRKQRPGSLGGGSIEGGLEGEDMAAPSIGKLLEKSGESLAEHEQKKQERKKAQEQERKESCSCCCF